MVKQVQPCELEWEAEREKAMADYLQAEQEKQQALQALTHAREELQRLRQHVQHAQVEKQRCGQHVDAAQEKLVAGLQQLHLSQQSPESQEANAEEAQNTVTANAALMPTLSAS